MRILGIDTATTTASVALIEDDELVAEKFYNRQSVVSENVTIAPKGNHAEIVVPLIQAVLDQAKFSLSDINGFAVSIGPGSFTGLRIALATVKGIAYELGLPVVGISTLHAQAARVTDTQDLICALLDARKQEVYAALFRRVHGTLMRLSDDGVMAVTTAIEMIERARQMGSCTAVGDGAQAYQKCLLQSLGSRLRIGADGEYSTVAYRVAEIAQARIGAAAGDDLGRLVPIYLRPSEAESRKNSRR
ncbi:MAG: peptidase glycoprotease [Deltaproteobacteria bacterium]|nr:peptidase glycoprotease [Deltaproteobacteria bacterium]